MEEKALVSNVELAQADPSRFSEHENVFGANMELPCDASCFLMLLVLLKLLLLRCLCSRPLHVLHVGRAQRWPYHTRVGLQTLKDKLKWIYF